MTLPWPTQPLADLCDVFSDGDWIESKDQSSGGIRLVQTGNVGEGNFKDRSEKARYISEDTFRRLRCTEIFQGDCLISRLPDPVGRSCIIPEVGERMITAVDCTIVRFKADVCLPEFFNYYTQSREYLLSVSGLCTGTTRNRISRSNLGRITVPIPALSEQKRIVSILDEAFEGIATAKVNAERGMLLLSELSSGFHDSVFADDDDQSAYKVLGDVCERVSVGHVGVTTPHYRDSGILFLRTQNVGKDGLDLSDRKYITREFHDSLKKSQVLAGDVLLSRVITNAVNCGVIPEGIGPANCANVVLVRPCDGLLSRYLEYYIRSKNAQRYLLARKVGSAQLVVNTSVVKAWPIPVPPVSRQEKVVGLLDDYYVEFSRAVSLYKSKLSALDDLKKSLLHHAFSGQL